MKLGESEPAMMWQPFFIIGVGRSGTTMLQRLLNRHSLVCVPDETHFIPKQRNNFLKLIRKDERHLAITQINAVEKVKEWNVSVSVEDIRGCDGVAAYARVIDLIMTRRAGKEGKVYWGEKTPSYILEIPTLHQLFPKARFIHIYRDGRDVALSVMPLSWGPNNSYAAGKWWRSCIQTLQKDRKRLNDQFLEVKYEDFIRHPGCHMQQICGFLELPYEEQILEGYEIKSHNFAKWKNKFYMSDTELKAFEVSAGDLLKELDYELAGKRIRLPIWYSLIASLDNNFNRVTNYLLR